MIRHDASRRCAHELRARSILGETVLPEMRQIAYGAGILSVREGRWNPPYVVMHWMRLRVRDIDRTRYRIILAVMPPSAGVGTPIGAVALLPDPDFRRRVFGCVSHVWLSRVARRLAERIEWRAWAGRCPGELVFRCQAIIMGSGQFAAK